MIDLYYWPTPNGWKVTIMLEECGLAYRTIPVDIGGGEQFKPEFLRISPNNRMPAIVDHEPLGGGKPLSIFESGAILEYLADKTGQFLPRRRRRALHGAAVGALADGEPRADDGQRQPLQELREAARRRSEAARVRHAALRRRGRSAVRRHGRAARRRTATSPAPTTASPTSSRWPWAMLLGRLIDEDLWTTFPNLKRWVDEVGARPAVERAAHHHKEWGERELSEEEQQTAQGAALQPDQRFGARGARGGGQRIAQRVGGAMESPDTWRAFAEALLGTADRTALDVARESGVEPDDLRRLWQALGFPPVAPDEVRFTRADVDAVRAVRALVEVQQADPSDVVQLTRVVGHAMARVSDAQITTIAERLNDASMSQPPQGELLARIGTLAPALEQFLGYVWRRHLVAAVLQLSAAPSAVDRPLIVGFADMVGFTSMSRALDSQQLARDGRPLRGDRT